MPTALFSIHCPTCQRRLKVQHFGAIGQILPCPKCGCMLQVVPPEGWQPPADPLPETVASGAVTAVAGEALQNETPTGAWSDPIGVEETTPRPPAALPPGVPPPRRTWLGVALGLSLLLGGGILAWAGWFLRSAPEVATTDVAPAIETTIPPQVIVAPPDEAHVASEPHAPQALETHDGAATDHVNDISPARATDMQTIAPDSPVPAPVESIESPITGESEEQAISSVPEASAPTAEEQPTPPEPTIIPLAIATVAPREPFPMLDPEELWSQPIAELRIDQMPLNRFVLFMSRLSACPLRLDLASLLPAGLEVDAAVQVNASASTMGDVLTSALSPLGLTAQTHDRGATIAVLAAESPQDERSYPWSDFGEKSPEVFVERLAKLVAPGDWQPPASLVVTPDALVVHQTTAIQVQINDFLSRLAKARARGNLTAEYADEPTLAQSLLEENVSANFRPAQRLEMVLSRLAQQAELRLVVDVVALAETGVSLDEPVAMSVVDEPLDQALDQALLPLGLSYRIVAPNILEVTSWARAAQSADVRVIDVGTLARGVEDGLALAIDYGEYARSHGRPPAATADATVVHYDPASKCLLVRAPHSAARQIAAHLASRLEALRAQ